jgi:chromatin remodeling complex protein RSC6
MANKKETTPKSSQSGLQKPLTPSPVLAVIIGNEAMPRTEMVKKIWEYIKKHDLQDKANKRMINADKPLKELFGGRDQISMFELAKVVSQHVK